MPPNRDGSAPIRDLCKNRHSRPSPSSKGYAHRVSTWNPASPARTGTNKIPSRPPNTRQASAPAHSSKATIANAKRAIAAKNAQKIASLHPSVIVIPPLPMYKSIRPRRRRSARQLALMYYHGKGTRQDDGLAFAWASVAAARGHGPAIDLRNDLAKSLASKPKMLDRAKELVLQYQKTYGNWP